MSTESKAARSKADVEDEPVKPLSRTLSSTSTSLTVPLARNRSRSRSPDTLSLVSTSDYAEQHRRQTANLYLPSPIIEESQDTSFTTEKAAGSLRIRLTSTWIRNKGLFFVLGAQAFGVLMNVSTRLLETGGDGARPLNPFQILFARMSITAVIASLYLWKSSIPDFPFGPKGVRALLVARGVGGFFGVIGSYGALQYLPLADVAVIGFLAPPLSCYVCSILLKEPFTRIEQLAGLVSLGGVVLIARPSALFHSGQNSLPSSESTTSTNHLRLLSRAVEALPPATSSQRLTAVGLALVSVFGATLAYTTIRWIGQRAHPLMSVNYFSVTSTIVSVCVLALVPSVHFRLPGSSWQWCLLFFIGTSGFLTQYLLTEGLRYEKSSRATNMMYTQMIFSVTFDFLIWGITPNILSIAGGTLILGSALVVAVKKQSTQPAKNIASPTDEEIALVSNMEEREEEHEAGLSSTRSNGTSVTGTKERPDAHAQSQRA